MMIAKNDYAAKIVLGWACVWAAAGCYDVIGSATDTDSNADGDMGLDTDSDADMYFDTNGDTDSDTNGDTDADTNVEVDSSANADTDIIFDTEPNLPEPFKIQIVNHS